MSLIRFLASGLALSFPILIGMIPIVLVFALLGFGAVSGLRNHPYYLAFVVIIVFVPLTSFLQLAAMSAGLMYRKQSRAPDLGRLIKKTWIIAGVQLAMALFYLALTLGSTAIILRPRSFDDWTGLGAALGPRADGSEATILDLAAYSMPLAVALITSSLIYAVLWVLLAIPFVAHAAGTASHGPRYEFFYGIGRKFFPLLLSFILIAVVQWAFGRFIRPQIMASLPTGDDIAFSFAAFRQPLMWIGAAVLFQLWCFCWWAASAVQAFIDVRDQIEEEYQLELGAIRANTGPQTDIAAMMRERSDRLRQTAAVHNPAGSFADLDEPVDSEPAEPPLFDDLAAQAEPESEPEPVDSPSARPMTTEEIEERFRQRFGGAETSGLRTDISSALREAAEIEAPAPEPEVSFDQVRASDLVTSATTPPLEAEQVPPVEPDLHENVPDSEDEPDWLSKYMGAEADANIFGDKKKADKT